MTIILTGFTPFGPVAVNPSQLIVEQIVQRGYFPEVVAAVLPTEYAASGNGIRDLIRTHQPDAVLCLGVAAKRTTISLERVALNLDDAPVADNAGDLAKGRMIDADAQLAYWATLPLERMLAALQEQQIPVSISNHAGAYVCNHVFFSSLRELEILNHSIPCGFIHVPDLCETPEQGPGLPLATMVTAVETCLRVLQASH
ncbi:MAG TPA: hypothetical protein VHO69_09890 [Phototrophicaceae bacterium]|nr:hypothetical protein [Phototrophicaceae bacterium]